jgi:hypothetical protein
MGEREKVTDNKPHVSAMDGGTTKMIWTSTWKLEFDHWVMPHALPEESGLAHTLTSATHTSTIFL